MAKLKLDMKVVPDVTLIGISCHVQDYRLCWALNNRFGWALTPRDPEREKKGQAPVPPMPYRATFDHIEPETEAIYTLVANRGDDGLLVKEQHQADFFLLVDEHASIAREELLENVRDAEFVLMAFPLDITKLKSGHKLLS